MLPLAGGTMTGSIQMSSGSKITGLADPIADTEAANKKYVDAAKAAASAVGAAAQTTANSALSTANNALPKAGGTMTGSINMSGSSISNLADLTSTSDGKMAANKNYVDTTISAAIAANDAMTFVGVLGTGTGQITDLPTSANVGDTYKVGVAGKYGDIEAKVGDLIINGAANDSDALKWIHISSGYEDDYLQKLAVSDNGIYLTDGVNNTSATGFVSGIDFVGNDNISIAVTAGTGNTPTHTVTASMVWGTF